MPDPDAPVPMSDLQPEDMDQEGQPPEVDPEDDPWSETDVDDDDAGSDDGDPRLDDEV
jgi:hypothetical protein